MNAHASYVDFLKAKVQMAAEGGFEVSLDEINPILLPHQKAMVVWACRGGRRAVFAKFGLGKSVIQIEILRLVLSRFGGRGLLVTPLGVRQEFRRDAHMLATGDHPRITDAQRAELLAWQEGRPDRVPSFTFIRSIEECEATGLYMTNYETVRDGKLDPRLFDAASLDEASCLRGFGGSKTFREFMRLFDGVRFKFVATATPSPNQFIELLAYSAFLEVMDIGQAKAQPLDAMILTPSGWLPMGEISVGDLVIASDGSPTRVQGVYPQGEQPIFRVSFSDGASTECTADHLWLTHSLYERNNERRYVQRNPAGARVYGSVKRTDEIAATLRAAGGFNHRIPCVGAIQFQKKDLRIDPWLLGALIGDGNLRPTSVVLSIGDEWVRDRAAERLPDGLYLRETGSGSNDYSITGTSRQGGAGPGSNALLAALRDYGMLGKRSHEKVIPADYMQSSVEDRLALLRGLMDTDGTITATDGQTIFCTTSPVLAEQVVELVRSLGGLATIRKASPCKFTRHQAFLVDVRLLECPFELPRKAARHQMRTARAHSRFIASVESVGQKPAQCIAVEHPDRLYVTDDFVLTHNTRFFKRNSEKADTLTIHPHKQREFWLWVASWALFVQKPSDLGFSDEGYDLPPMVVHWHELPADHAGAGTEKNGQGRLLRNASASLSDAAREKRDSLPARIEKLMALRAENPDAHRLIWHDLEAERAALEAAIPGLATVYGTQGLDEREEIICSFSDGRIQELAGKPSMLGSGPNFQYHCWWEIFLGIGFKFNDFIQGVHRIYRFMQDHEVRLDLIYTEAERPVRDNLQDKWNRHEEQMEIMTGIIKEYGLSAAAMAATLTRSLGVERIEVSGEGFRVVNNDCVLETQMMAENSVDLIVTSIPFSTQYEYSPNYADFGHTDDNGHFWKQMDFLIPQLLRVLSPGRIAAIHVKDRIVPGGMTGLGFQTVYPFSDDCIRAFQAHGFAFLSRKTITTDVVRENNQTYRLGWSEQCKDGSRMGNGMPEYLLIFRKPPTDASNGYADLPVKKDKRMWDGAAGAWSNDHGYSRARWQLDAHGYMPSSGNRQLTPADLAGLEHHQIYKLWKRYSLEAVYDFEHHVKIAEHLEEKGALPSTFMLLPPHSAHDDVWTDVARMLSMNTLQAQAGREMHLCPLQFDIVDRCIEQYTEKGETVFDPFGGLMTVPYRAIRHGRRGEACELNPAYFLDGCKYVEAAAREMAMPSLFDLMGAVE